MEKIRKQYELMKEAWEKARISKTRAEQIMWFRKFQHEGRKMVKLIEQKEDQKKLTKEEFNEIVAKTTTYQKGNLLIQRLKLFKQPTETLE